MGAGQDKLHMLALLGTLIGFSNGPVFAADLHTLWDRQCGGCHGHAGEFARQWLSLVDGELKGTRIDEDVATFLLRHNGGYAPGEITAIIDMLRAQVATPAIFSELCRECHGTAAQFIREQIVSRDGELYGRYSNRRVAETIRRHGGLDAEQAALMLEALSRIEHEVHRH